MLKITPSNEPGRFRMGRLPPNITEEMITQRLGIDPVNEGSSDGKVTVEWRFLADGEPCGIWDYKGARWSTFGPHEVFAQLFSNHEPDA
jgi:hypothetical protein